MLTFAFVINVRIFKEIMLRIYFPFVVHISIQWLLFREVTTEILMAL